MERNEFALAGGFALLLSSALLIATVIAGASGSDVAQWVQAIGSILAILATGILTWWATNRTLQPILDEKKGRAKVLIYRLLPPIARIKSTTVRVRQAYDQTEGGMLLVAAGRLEEAAYFFRIDTILPTDVLSDLHVLSDALSENVAQLYFYLSQYNDFIDRNVPLMRGLDSEGRQNFSEKFEVLFQAIDSLAGKCWQLLQSARVSEGG
jgi:hypothetical protein